MVVDYRVEAVAPPDVRGHRATLDRPGPDQRDLDHQVVEHPRPQPRQGGHLRARFNLEHPDGIGAGQHFVYRRFGQVQRGQVDLDAFVLCHQVNGVVQRRKHTEPEQVEFHQTDCRAIIFVPLQHTAVLHTCPLDRTDVGDRPIADHHAAGVDAHVPRQVLDLLNHLAHLLGNVFDVRWASTPVADLFAPRILLPLRETQGTSHVAHRDPGPVGDHVGDLSRIVTAVFVVDVLDGLFALIRLDVDVDVGWAVAYR